MFHLMVGALFGAPLGLVERSPEEYCTPGTPGDYVQQPRDGERAACCLTVCTPHKEKTDNQGIDVERQPMCLCKQAESPDENLRQTAASGVQTLYIRGNKLETNEVLILAMIVVPFIITVATTFWDRYWLRESYSCTEDPGIYCFPQAIPPTTNSDLNISYDTPKIKDCSVWMTDTISSNVTFRCYQCVHDSEGAFAALGGLVTVFKFITKGGISLLIILTGKLIAMCSQPHSYNTIKMCFKCVRITFAVLFACVEISIAFALGVSYAQHRLSYGYLANHTSIQYQVFDHLNEPLVAVGIFTTSLFLPLEEFTIARRRSIINGYDRLDMKNFSEGQPLLLDA